MPSKDAGAEPRSVSWSGLLENDGSLGRRPSGRSGPLCSRRFKADVGEVFVAVGTGCDALWFWNDS